MTLLGKSGYHDKTSRHATYPLRISKVKVAVRGQRSYIALVMCFWTITGPLIMGILNNLAQMLITIRRLDTPHSHNVSHISRSRLEVKGQIML